MLSKLTRDMVSLVVVRNRWEEELRGAYHKHP